MHKKTIFALLFCFFGAVSAYGEQFPLLEPIGAQDRVLILAPHPDDEAIGCAGIIQQAVEAGAAVKVCYLTNGDHNEFAFIVYKKDLILRKGEFIAMGQVRREEAIKAMELLGLSKEDLIFLGYPDFGTFNIFTRFWQSKKPYRSLLTRISSVPYKDDMTFGTPYKAENILSDLKKVLLDFEPTKIFVSHPADVNVDHKTFYLFLQVALRDLAGQIPGPEVYPYLVHWPGWPLPRHYHPELPLAPPKQFSGFNINWTKYELTPEQLEKKHKAILCSNSQTRSSAFYLMAFARSNELFGDFQEVELSAPGMPAGRDTTGWLAFKNTLLSFLGFIEEEPQDTEEVVLKREQVQFGLDDDSLLIWITKKKETAWRRALANIYLFGYSDNTPFAEMPKIRINTKYNIVHVYEGGIPSDNKGIELDLFQKKIFLRIPLKVLGDPDFILASVRSYTGALPMHYTGFRRIDISRD